MALRAYTCNLWKELRIGKYVKFVGGEFETDNPELQALIESNNAFGSAIHYKDTLEEMEEKSRLRAVEIAANKARRRQQLLDEIAEEDRIEREREEKYRKHLEQISASKSMASVLAAADKVVAAEQEPEQEPLVFGGITPEPEQEPEQEPEPEPKPGPEPKPKAKGKK